MKSCLAVVAVVLTVAIAGCDRRAAVADADADAHAEAVSAGEPAIPAAVITAAPASPAVPTSPTEVGPRRDGLPHFAAVYPDAQIEGDPLIASGAAGPGGVLTFSTDASPETVIAFYRQRAEADGLATMMSLNQGEARAYGAQKQATGASLNVVAAPSDGGTSVQLTWSAGL